MSLSRSRRLSFSVLLTSRAWRRLAPLCLAAVAFACLVCANTAGARRTEPRQQSSQIPTQTPTPQTEPRPTPTPAPVPTPRNVAPAQDGPALPAEDEIGEVERISADLTNVLLTATDRKRQFVNTLRAEDLRVLEDGAPQEILAFERETDAPLSLALLLDTSASQERVLKDEQRAAQDFLRAVLRPARDAAAIVSFTGITRIEQPLTADLAWLEAAVGRLKVTHTLASPECTDSDVPEEVRRRCTTAVWDSIHIATREVLARTPEHTRRAIILLSDGDDTDSRLRLYQAAEFAIRNNVAVYSIGIRDKDFEAGELRRDQLRRISEDTGGRAFFPKKPEDLASAFAQIESELRSQYLLSYRPSNRARDGAFRRVEIEVVNPQFRKQKLRLFYRQGYYAQSAEGRATARPSTSP